MWEREHPLSEKSSVSTERKYIYGPTGIIAVIDNGVTYYLFKDHLGSVRAVMNGATGAGVEYNAYNAWGDVMQAQVSPDVHYKFTGQEFDTKTGIYNYRARMYSQRIGRFYAIDPAGQGFGPYNYAGNNPISFVDPTGRVDQGFDADWQMEEWQQTQEMNRENRFTDIGSPFTDQDFFIDDAEMLAAKYRAWGDWAQDGQFHTIEEDLTRSTQELYNQIMQASVALTQVLRDQVRDQFNKLESQTGNKFDISDHDMDIVRGQVQDQELLSNMGNQSGYGNGEYDGQGAHGYGQGPWTENPKWKSDFRNDCSKRVGLVLGISDLKTGNVREHLGSPVVHDVLRVQVVVWPGEHMGLTYDNQVWEMTPKGFKAGDRNLSAIYNIVNVTPEFYNFR